jgi:mannose-1-phosphate guanylyltransferase
MALVLTAGQGARLRPLSRLRAKPAVPLAGEAIIRRILRWLAARGVRHAVLNLHHHPASIAAEVGDGGDLGLAVRYSWEQPLLLGSGGGPRRALPLLGHDTFLIVNGDTLTDMDLDALADAHAASGARVTLALSPDRDPQRYGGVTLDAGGAVTGFVRKGDAGPACHFIGVQIVHRAAFADVPDDVVCESFTGVYAALIAQQPGRVRGFVTAASFWDVGTPADYLAASLAMVRREGLAAAPIGRGSTVHASSRLVDTIVWDGASVGADCELVRCVVADGAIIPAGARFHDAVIVPADGRTPEPGERLVDRLLVTPIRPAGV